MRVLFFMNHAGFARNFELPLRELAGRGHEVVLALERHPAELGDRARLFEQLVAEHPELSSCAAPSLSSRSWGETGRALRMGLDYMRFLDPAYSDAARPRRRAAGRMPAPFTRIARSRLRSTIAKQLAEADRSLPVSPVVREFIRAQRPDLVVVTPLVELGSPQLEYVRAARELGIPSALPVAAWDHLTMKGGIHDAPDLVAVWNEAQRDEAVALHGAPPERVEITGAMAYDHWFDWPRTRKEDFCRQIGLDPERPYILYAGSSTFITPDEASFVAAWAQRLRHEPEFQEVQIVYRPHPTQNGVARNGRPSGVITYPTGGVDPQDEPTRADYFNSIFHSDLVVAINTSAMIEASIIGRPVYTVISRYRDSQLGTLHFRQLLPENGGVVHVAYSLPDHARQLATALERESDPETVSRKHFVEHFVHDDKPDPPSTRRLVDALERTATHPAQLGQRTGGSLAKRLVSAVTRYTVRLALRVRRAATRAEPAASATVAVVAAGVTEGSIP